MNSIQLTKMRINGIESRDVRSTGVFEADVVNDAMTFHTRVYVSEKNVIPMKLVIGIESLAEANVMVLLQRQRQFSRKMGWSWSNERRK